MDGYSIESTYPTYDKTARAGIFLLLEHLANTAIPWYSVKLIKLGNHSQRTPSKDPGVSENTGVGACRLSGAIHSGSPCGRVGTIGGLQTYVSEPENNSKAKSNRLSR